MGGQRKRLRRLLRTAAILFIGMNLMAAVHGYRFTQVDPPDATRTGDEASLSTAAKAKAVLLGVSVPRSVNDKTPLHPFLTVTLPGADRREAWYLPAEAPLGTVILFHGYGGCSSGMLDKAEVLRRRGFNCLLPDFRGAGGSAGTVCTIGYREASEVREWYALQRSRCGGPLFLMGQSMGAVAVMKAMNDRPMPVAGLILECPYGSMLQTVKNRFRIVGLPAFPMAQLLVFWGGALRGFNAFGLDPVSYAKRIRVPVLLVHGTKDVKVTEAETAAIFANLPRGAVRAELPLAGHNDYLETSAGEWTASVESFLTAGAPAGKRKN